MSRVRERIPIADLVPAGARRAGPRVTIVPPTGELRPLERAGVESTLAAPPPIAAAASADTRLPMAETAIAVDTAATTRPRSSSAIQAVAVLAQLAEAGPGAPTQLVIGETIGQGGMGIVRAAEQLALGRTVAVKTLRRRDPLAAIDLLREAWLTGAISHPNVVPIHFVDVGPDEMPRVVMKRIEGVAWSELCANPGEVARKFGATDLLAWNLGVLMQVLNAVRYAHHRGVLHRDLKPANVMIGDFGEVFLVDWGIAVSLHDDGSGRLPLAANATALAGTPAYMAPEMLGRAGSPPLSERTDVYLAGAVLYELITGAVPHPGDDVISVIASIVTNAPELPASVPTELARICERAMSSDPADRYPSADAMRLALQAFLEHRGSTELAARAHGWLDELIALLAKPESSSEDIFRTFGACRFGFHEALAVWQDNLEARAGLRAAAVAVAEHELAANRPTSALALLADIDAPELLARVRVAVATHDRERASLEQLRADNDASVAWRPRLILAGALGCLFGAAPMLNAVLATIHTGREWATGATIGSIFALGILTWLRPILRTTRINRQVLAAIVGGFALNAIGTDAFALHIQSLADVELANMGMWAMFAALLPAAFDRRMLPSAVFYALALIVGAMSDAALPWAFGLANVALSINVALFGDFKTLRADRARAENRPAAAR